MHCLDHPPSRTLQFVGTLWERDPLDSHIAESGIWNYLMSPEIKKEFCDTALL